MIVGVNAGSATLRIWSMCLMWRDGPVSPLEARLFKPTRIGMVPG
jgi:hypothetical protein